MLKKVHETAFNMASSTLGEIIMLWVCNKISSH